MKEIKKPDVKAPMSSFIGGAYRKVLPVSDLRFTKIKDNAVGIEMLYDADCNNQGIGINDWHDYNDAGGIFQYKTTSIQTKSIACNINASGNVKHGVNKLISSNITVGGNISKTKHTQYTKTIISNVNVSSNINKDATNIVISTFCQCFVSDVERECVLISGEKSLVLSLAERIPVLSVTTI
jgi:hypothetical protein